MLMLMSPTIAIGHGVLMSRNMAVLASVQDRVEAWNKATKMPAEEEEDDGKALQLYTWTSAPCPYSLL